MKKGSKGVIGRGVGKRYRVCSVGLSGFVEEMLDIRVGLTRMRPMGLWRGRPLDEHFPCRTFKQLHYAFGALTGPWGFDENKVFPIFSQVVLVLSPLS
jgi:hypothetical protein